MNKGVAVLVCLVCIAGLTVGYINMRSDENPVEQASSQMIKWTKAWATNKTNLLSQTMVSDQIKFTHPYQDKIVTRTLTSDEFIQVVTSNEFVEIWNLIGISRLMIRATSWEDDLLLIESDWIFGGRSITAARYLYKIEAKFKNTNGKWLINELALKADKDLGEVVLLNSLPVNQIEYVSTMGMSMKIRVPGTINSEFLMQRITSEDERKEFANYVTSLDKLNSSEGAEIYLSGYDYESKVVYAIFTPLTTRLLLNQPYHFRGSKDLIFEVSEAPEKSQVKYYDVRIYVVDKDEDTYKVIVRNGDQDIEF